MKNLKRRYFAVMRLVAGNLFMLLALLLLLGAVGEVYYRFFYDSTDSFALTKVCQRWFDRHYEENNVGVRDNIPYRLAGTPGVPRITFVGDSFTAGHGVKNVEDRFVNRIRARVGPTQEVHMVAANGMDTGEQISLLKKLLRSGYQTDRVVLVYVPNDIADLVPEWAAIVKRIYGEQAEEPWLIRNSYVLNMLYYRWKAFRDPDIRDYYGFVRTAYAGPLWYRQQQRLVQMADVCRSAGAEFSVVIFPFLHTLDDPAAYMPVHRKLRLFWDRQGVPYLDLLELFVGEAPRSLKVGAVDAHPNEKAHRLAAKEIAAFLGLD